MRFGPFANRTLPYWRGWKYAGEWVSAWFRLLTKGYHVQESWNIDKSVAKFIAPLLRDMAKYTICFPPSDSIHSLDEWKAFLLETAELFESYPWEYEKTDEAYKRLGEYGPTLWW